MKQIQRNDIKLSIMKVCIQINNIEHIAGFGGFVDERYKYIYIYIDRRGTTVYIEYLNGKRNARNDYNDAVIKGYPKEIGKAIDFGFF